MLSNFIYSVNVILPIFILVSLGFLLKHLRVIGEDFSGAVDKLIFKLCLPAMLFLEVAGSDISDTLNPRLIIFAAVAITVSFLVVSFIVILFVKDNGKRGAMIQGSCRSNFAILGVPLIENMFGNSGLQEVALVMPVSILLFNTYSVIVLSIFAPVESKLSPGQTVKRILKNILTNPLIIGVVLGIPFMLLDINVSLVMDKTLRYLANMVTPAALISLGSTVRFDTFQGRLRFAVSSTFTKTVLLPVLMVGSAVLLGFRGESLGVILILFGAPTAVSSYIMAKSMKSDYDLAGQILLLTTMLCLFTIFIGIFILKSFGLI